MKMKTLLKNKVSEKTIEKAFEKILIEKKEVFYDVFLEALEDYALEKAMQEGSNSKKVSRKKVFEILDKANEG
jgi:ribosomal protein L12E/L44/L45/RPP1/RPP2